MTRIGVPKEVKNHEYRVAITPIGVHELVAHGHEVVVEHLPRLTMPCLFISGTRDAFGTPEELTRWTATIPGPVTHVWAEGKGHDLKGADALIDQAVTEWLATL